MPVTIRKMAKARSARGVAFDRKVLAYADLLLAGQAAGFISPAELADWLDSQSVPSFYDRDWAASSVRRVLLRGIELGVPFVLRSRSAAGAGRFSRRRCASARKDLQRAAVANQHRPIQVTAPQRGVPQLQMARSCTADIAPIDNLGGYQSKERG